MQIDLTLKSLKHLLRGYCKGVGKRKQLPGLRLWQWEKRRRGQRPQEADWQKVIITTCGRNRNQSSHTFNNILCHFPFISSNLDIFLVKNSWTSFFILKTILHLHIFFCRILLLLFNNFFTKLVSFLFNYVLTTKPSAKSQ